MQGVSLTGMQQVSVEQALSSCSYWSEWHLIKRIDQTEYVEIKNGDRLGRLFGSGRGIPLPEW